MPYAIWNTKYKKWLYGTDFRTHPYRQILDRQTPKLWRDRDMVRWEFRRRMCGREYQIKKVIIKEQFKIIVESEK